MSLEFASSLCSVLGLQLKGSICLQNYLVQSTMSSFGDPADVAYVLSQIQPVYSNLSASGDITSDEYYAAWQEPWYQQAELNMQLAANLSSANRPDKLGISETYWKACNYYFTGLL